MFHYLTLISFLLYWVPQIYFYVKSRRIFSTKSGKSVPFAGAFWFPYSMIKCLLTSSFSLSDVQIEARKNYGEIFSTSFLNKLTCVVSGHDLVKEVLTNTFDFEKEVPFVKVNNLYCATPNCFDYPRLLFLKGFLWI